MATCKAVAFDPLKIACQQDPDKASHFLASLSEEHRTIYEKSLPVTKVPIEAMSKILETFSNIFYAGQDFPMRHLGAISAHQILTGVYKIFARIASPAFIISRAPMIWRSYYDKGTIVMENVTATGGTMVICDFPELTPTLREFIAGYCVGGLQLGGVKTVVVTKNDDDPNRWRYDYRWK